MSTSIPVKKVLFVDDESSLVALGAAMLGALGYECSAFASADEAIAEFRLHPDAYTAAFTDLKMPLRSGCDVARELLAIRRDLPVFLMSGDVSRDDRARAIDIGVRKIVLKPVSLDELREMLSRVA